MQSNDVIEVVTPLGVGATKLPYSRMWLPFLRALRVYWRSRAAVRHLSSVASHIALFVRRVEIPAVGRERKWRSADAAGKSSPKPFDRCNPGAPRSGA